MRRSDSIILVTIFLITLIKIPSAQITFSEIMFDVATNEYHDEFIEIFNCSYSDSVDIGGFQFSDSAGVDNILPFRGGKKIPPRSFAIILDGSYLENSSVYDQIIPDSVIILKISDNSFGKNGLSNTSSEYLTIMDSTGYILSAYSYTVGNIPGRSDEKIDLDGENDQSNWADSKRLGGTPGWQNSVTPLKYDFGLDETSLILPEKIFAEASVIISIQIYQYGTSMLSDSMEVLAFSDMNGDTTFQEDDVLIGKRKISTTAQKIDFEWKNIYTGRHDIIVRIRFEKDENPENDRMIRSVEVFDRTGKLNINEIMFLPEADEPEWLELYNSGEEEVYLKGWSIADKSDTVSIDISAFISPAEYLVISEGQLPVRYQLSNDHLIILKKFITFNNQGDEIRLIAPSGEENERVAYNSDWLEGEAFRNPSLEKINPILAANMAENWGPGVSPLGSTPGYRNSIFSDLNKVQGNLIAKPDPFSPDGDGIDDVTIISGTIPETNARIRAMIFDVKGRQIRILRENRFTGSQFNFVWDGKDDNGHLSRIGIYIVYIQVLNDRRGTLHEMKTTVILAQIL